MVPQAVLLKLFGKVRSKKLILSGHNSLNTSEFWLVKMCAWVTVVASTDTA